jgi:glyoxylase-like metal-dependent hydrolase (beta-lactamase superfamily II)/rhodanese-related sulfurtransferase
MVRVFPVRDPGLGNTSYVVDLGDGSALVVDPERDPRPYLEVAANNRLVIRHVAETHLHADFVSGARELVAQGATLIAPRRSDLAHPHRGVGEGEELVIGDLTLSVLETPGHTPEHVAYLLQDGSTPRVLFSGGTLMAGGVARPDLISPDDTESLARQAYRSVRRLLHKLPDDVEVLPTHGAGSFCSSPDATPVADATVGSERLTHPAMTIGEEHVFVDRLLGGLGSFPDYFLRLREVNRGGPKVYGPELPALTPLEVADLDGATVVDVRPIDQFAQGHIPGSISIALRDQFGTWLGWLLESDTPVLFVLDPDQDERELVRQTLNIGHENIVGRIEVADWLAAGRELANIALVPAADVEPGTSILDVRQDSEWSGGGVPGAIHVELGDIADGAANVGPGMVVHCGHGQRAMTAASLLARAGRSPAAVTAAGYTEIQRAVTAS